MKEVGRPKEGSGWNKGRKWVEQRKEVDRPKEGSG